VVRGKRNMLHRGTANSVDLKLNKFEIMMAEESKNGQRVSEALTAPPTKSNPKPNTNTHNFFFNYANNII